MHTMFRTAELSLHGDDLLVHLLLVLRPGNWAWRLDPEAMAQSVDGWLKGF